MIKTVKAKVIDGVLTPLEPITLEEGVEYRLTLVDIPSASEGDCRQWRSGGFSRHGRHLGVRPGVLGGVQENLVRGPRCRLPGTGRTLRER